MGRSHLALRRNEALDLEIGKLRFLREPAPAHPFLFVAVAPHPPIPITNPATINSPAETRPLVPDVHSPETLPQPPTINPTNIEPPRDGPPH
jgi:hypothetical protein